MNKPGKFPGSGLNIEIKKEPNEVGNEASQAQREQGGAAAKAPPPLPVHCLCSPTKHAGSFRCRHHRNSAPGKENI
ncbi:hypothetical protein ACS0TY_033290 [Phlomoides rotata]